MKKDTGRNITMLAIGFVGTIGIMAVIGHAKKKKEGLEKMQNLERKVKEGTATVGEVVEYVSKKIGNTDSFEIPKN